MIEEQNSIQNTAIYSEDRTHRYLLSRIWDEKKTIPLFVSKCSGEADGIFLEVTNMLITNNLYRLGYGGYYAVNLCSGIYGKTDKLADAILVTFFLSAPIDFRQHRTKTFF